MPGVTVELVGAEEVARVLASLPPRVADAVRNELNATAIDIQREARRRAPAGVGGGAGLKGSIRPRMLPGDDLIAVEVFTDKEYAAYVEFGTPPGHFPPPGVLTAWLKKKGIPVEAEFAVARGIYLHGTKPQPFLFPAYEQEAPNFKRNLAASVRKAAETRA